MTPLPTPPAASICTTEGSTASATAATGSSIAVDSASVGASSSSTEVGGTSAGVSPGVSAASPAAPNNSHPRATPATSTARNMRNDGQAVWREGGAVALG